MKQFIRYFWNTIAHPQTNFDRLAAEHTVRWAVVAAALPVLQVWGNVALHRMFGLDWLGTKPFLTDPTFVGGFGQWRVILADWVPVFVVLMPFLALLNLVINAGVAQLMSKLWSGQGTFEQMVNTLTFASVVPKIVIGGISEWVFSVPMDLITGPLIGGKQPCRVRLAPLSARYGTSTFWESISECNGHGSLRWELLPFDAFSGFQIWQPSQPWWQHLQFRCSWSRYSFDEQESKAA